MNDKERRAFEDEIAKLRVERDELYARLQSEEIEAQRDSDLYEDKRTLEYEIAALKRGDFPGSPPSEQSTEYDDDLD